MAENLQVDYKTGLQRMGCEYLESWRKATTVPKPIWEWEKTIPAELVSVGGQFHHQCLSSVEGSAPKK